MLSKKYTIMTLADKCLFFRKYRFIIRIKFENAGLFCAPQTEIYTGRGKYNAESTYYFDL